MDLAELQLDTFAYRIGETFTVAAQPDPIPLTLTEAEPVGGGKDRQAFSLVFQGPAQPVLGQQTLPLEHAQLGRLEIFLVPIAGSADGAQYQAVFA